MGRWAVRLVFVLILALQLGDFGAPQPVVPFSLWQDACSGISISAQTYRQFWYNTNGHMRMDMSKPAGVRLRRVFREVVLVARKRGYHFHVNTVRQSKPELEGRIPLQIRFTLAVTYHGPRMILVNSWWMDRLNDQQLRLLLAHELGHAIDAQNQRSGNAFLDQLPMDGDNEEVADRISASLYGANSVFEFGRAISIIGCSP